MRPEDVPPELVEKAARALNEPGVWSSAARMRHALAAVLPDIQAQTLRDEASRTVTHHFHSGDFKSELHSSRSRAFMQARAAEILKG